MKQFYYSILILCVVTVFRTETFAQNYFEANASGIYSSNGKTPFWNQANQNGIIPSNSPSFFAIGSLHSDFKRDSSGNYSQLLDWGYGVTGGAVVSEDGIKGVLPVAYLKAKIWEIEIAAGRVRQLTGLTGDSSLTSGSYSLSGNALPVPGFHIAVPEFRPLRFTKGWVALKGGYSERFMGNNYIRYNDAGNISNTMLHSKSVTLKIGNENYFPFKIIAGANHQVIWGGNPDIYDELLIKSSIGTYKNVILV